MKAKLVKNLSANTLQLVINQISGLVIFYVLSVNLDKNTFGEINLALALMLTSFSILAFGIEQVSVRKIAAGDHPQQVLSLYIIHVLITGCIFYGLLLLGSLFFSSRISYYHIVLLIGIGKTAIHFSMPFKQAAVGMERFGLLARMCIITNLSRAAGLSILALLHLVNLQTVLFVFIGGDVLELFIGFLFFKKETGLPIALQWSWQANIALLRESLPQFGVVLITATLARFDWIFIGVFVSAIKLAEYSFAYKVFELSGVPLLAIASVLLPWFTRIFKNGTPDPGNLKLLVRMEMVVASATVVLLNSCWTPFIDPLTHGKYGLINERVIFLLSLCIPLQYLCNVLWTIFFAKGQLKLILTAFIITFCVNIIGDIILIPLYKNEGAAIVCLAGFFAQAIYYLSRNEIKALQSGVYSMLICMGCACVSVFATRIFFTDVFASAEVPAITFIILLILTTQLRLSDVKNIRALFR